MKNVHDLALARTAFGDLYAWGEKYQRSITIACFNNGIICTHKEITQFNDNPETSMGCELSHPTPESVDELDEECEGLFERALERLGPLAPHEGYGFVPALCAGGQAYLENLQKLDMRIHLDILKQLDSTPPKLPFWGMSFNYD